MSNEELVEKMKEIKNKLENVKKQLKNTQELLNETITFDNEGFGCDKFLSLNTRLNKQINNLDNKIIPKINNM